MERENQEDGKDLPFQIHEVKDQMEKERLLHIKKTIEERFLPSVAAHASHHHSLALNRANAENDNGEEEEDKNTLLYRMKHPLRVFEASPDSVFVLVTKEVDLIEEDDVIKEDDVIEEDDLIPTIRLPYIEQLPRFTTWVHANRSQLMDEHDTVIGKKQIYYKDGETAELNSEDDEEEGEKEKEAEEKEEKEPKKEKYNFSKETDKFIWKIGQDHDLDDLVVQSALTKHLEVDVSFILERYNELKIKNNENVEEDSDFTTDRRYCRRCLIFDCRLHEYQSEIKSRGSTSNVSENEDDKRPCSEYCYLNARSVTEADNLVVDNDNNSVSKDKDKNVVSDTNTETEDGPVNNEVTTDIVVMWTPVEKDLYLTGVQIFGRNSCLITTNILSGLKTCQEVYNYMNVHDQCTELVEIKTPEPNIQVNKKVSRKSNRFVRRKGKHRKSARCPPALKKTHDDDPDKIYKQYTPCSCESTCGDQCVCLTSENCCEKYCGCPKDCKNRFGGCNCAIGQCINRQCPCFAARRECDPDLCRSCWIGCGDGSISETSDQIQCKNMRFLLNQNKKILIAKSDVHGWGAFTKSLLKKNEFLGEYTGELISHDEADERGRVEEKIGYSYLFTLNAQHEIDARRKGNKFRFLNNSAKPNCYSKLIMVRGDHRIGLFAEKAIEEGEELFFDYGYKPKQAPWYAGRGLLDYTTTPASDKTSKKDVGTST